jgi:hypothetical protein
LQLANGTMFTFSIDSSMLQQSSESSEVDTDTDTDTGPVADVGGSDSSSGQVEDDGERRLQLSLIENTLA